MKNKKHYEIIYAICLVYRKSGIVEIETFSFLYDKYYDIHIATTTIHLRDKLQNAIDFYNKFCPEDYVITKFENESFEKVGEIWL